MKLLIATLLMVPILTSCAYVEGPISKETLGGIERVGVISGLSYEVHHNRIAFFRPFNEFESKNVSHWGIPEYSEALIVNQLKQNPAIKKVAALQGIARVQKDVEDRFALDMDSVIAAAKDQGFDTVIMVTPAGYPSIRDLKSGYGLHKDNALDYIPACVYANLYVTITDVASQRTIGQSASFGMVRGICADERIVWKEKFASYSETEMKQLETIIKNKLKADITESLQTLGLK